MDQLELLFEVAETSWDGLWFVDFDGAIQFSNYEAGQLFGVDRLTGPMRERLPADLQPVFEEHLGDVRDGGSVSKPSLCTLVRDDLTTVQAYVSESVYRRADGRAAGLLLRVADARRSEAIWQAHRVGQMQLSFTQLSNRAGTWEWDLAHDVVTVSAELVEHLNWSERTTPASSREFYELIHDNDKEGVMQAVVRALKSTDRHLSFTARMRSELGWRWVCGRAEAETDATGTTTHLRGLLIDVEDTITTELSLKDQASQTSLMHTVTVAANGAATLADLVRLSRDLILIHDDWTRGMVFLVNDDELEPLYSDESQYLEDQANPKKVRHDQALAERVLASGSLLWDDERLTISLPIRYNGRIHAILTATSEPPLYRHEMIEGFARHMVLQAERVVEREHAAIKLATARDEAMAASHDKSKFLAMMSHEIRTPLNGLIGLNQLLLRTDLGAEQRRLAQGAETSGRDLLRLINDTLDLSKAQAGRLTLEKTDFDIRSVVSNVVTPAQEGARAKGVRVEVEYAERLPTRLRGDPIRLTQVIGNLVGNALKFTSSGSIKVSVGGHANGDRWLLRGEVDDTGVGIDPSADHLFEPFRQADDSTTRRFGGTGLGLAICLEIVEAMGGQIGYESELGQGSTFHFTVPLGVAAHADQPPHAGRARDRSLRTARVLVVEDHPISQEVARGMLLALGQRVEVVGDAERALEIVASGRPDIVFMDLHLPGMDGCEATRLIRTHEAGERIPVIGMSASWSQEQQGPFRDCGVDDFVAKPVDLTVLAAVLGRWLGQGPREAAGVPTGTAFVSTELDVTRLETLRDMLAGDPSRLVATLTHFIDRREEDFGALDNAVSAAQIRPWQFAAHRLAGSAGSIGAHRVTRLARRMEREAETLGPDEARERLHELSHALDSACAELGRYLIHLEQEQT